MDHNTFYAELFRPIEKEFGPIDAAGIFPIIGFDCGGPINFSTVGAEEKKEFVTYVTCELSVRDEQVPSSCGRFELLCHSNDEPWVRSVITDLARMTLRDEFDHGHTVDVSALVDKSSTLNGVILERFAAVQIGGKPYCILRVHGIFADEMQLAMKEGADALFARLKDTGVYPRTFSARQSTVTRPKKRPPQMPDKRQTASHGPPSGLAGV